MNLLTLIASQILLAFAAPAADVIESTAPESSATVELTPGRVGGPGFARTRVQAHSTDTFYIDFHGSALALVEIRGDGDTDLDLYVYDEFGNLVASDLDSTDFCIASFVPGWTGRFRIEVRNLGSVWNAYTLRTN